MRAAGYDLVVSFDDTAGTPAVADLQHTVTAALAAGATIAKVATTVHGQDDVDRSLALQGLARDTGHPVAVMGMGHGALAATSRVELARAGSLFVFAQAGLSSAPGQPSLEWLVGQLRARH